MSLSGFQSYGKASSHRLNIYELNQHGRYVKSDSDNVLAALFQHFVMTI